MTIKNILSKIRQWRAAHKIASACFDGAALYAAANAGATAVDEFTQPSSQVVEDAASQADDLAANQTSNSAASNAIDSITDAIIPTAYAEFREAIKIPPNHLLIESVNNWFTSDILNSPDGPKESELDKVVSLTSIYLKLPLTERFHIMPYVTLPVGWAKNTTLGQESYGIGDLEASLAFHYNIGKWTFMLSTESAFPTGDNDGARKVNLGNDAYKLGEWLRATGDYDWFVITLGAGYNRFFPNDENSTMDKDTGGIRWTLGFQPKKGLYVGAQV